MLKISVAAVWLFFFATFAFAVESETSEYRCGGSEGPKPLSKIYFPGSGTKFLKGTWGIKDFAIWSSTKTGSKIAYRNDRNSLWLQDLNNSGLAYHGNVSLPLDRVLEPEGKFLLISQAPWLYDFRSKHWNHIAKMPSLVTHLFWKGDKVFSLAYDFSPKGEPAARIYRYKANEASAKEVCGITLGSEKVKLAQGNEFPHVYFYNEQIQPDGTHLSVKRLDVRFCRLKEIFFSKDPLMGPVESVMRFEKQDGLAVKISHPTHNLLWQSRKQGCFYYDLDGLTPMPLNFSQPVMAAWSPKRTGIEIIYLTAEKRVRLFGNIPFNRVEAKNLWLTEDAKTLYLAPRFYGESHAQLFLTHLAHVQD
jgi:hypothetical protein